MLFFKICTNRAPYSGEFRGFRMKLAQGNDSGPNGQPAFTPRFLVAESGDFTELPTTLQQLLFVQQHAQRDNVTFVQGVSNETPVEDSAERAASLPRVPLDFDTSAARG